MIRKVVQYLAGMPLSMVRAVRRLGWPGRILVALVGMGVMTLTAVEVTG